MPDLPDVDLPDVHFNASAMLHAIPTIDVSLSPRQWQYFQVAYLSFGFLWTYLFIAAIGITTISGCVVYFYYMDADTAADADNREIFMHESRFADNQTDFPLLTMLWYVIRFSLGTMALGSLLLAIVESIRFVLEAIDQQTKDAQEGNAVLKVAMKCCKCCMWCFEKSIKFISSYAYVYVFMENKSFCASCWSTFQLMSAHTVQLAINTAVQWMLTMIQSVSIPLASTILAYQSFISSDSVAGVALFKAKQDASPYVAALVPTTAVLLLSWVIARSFSSVYEQVVTALTVCVLHDIDALKRPVAHMRNDIREAFEIPKTIEIEEDDGAEDYDRQAKPLGRQVSAEL